MSDKKEITTSYIHEKSDIVPEWVNHLDDLKNKIKSDIHASNKVGNSGVKFLYPVDVPSSQKR